MFPMFRSELNRLRSVGLWAALLHLAVLRASLATGDLFSPGTAKMAVAMVVYGAGGLILGILQWKTYTEPSRWTFLVHRPVAPGRIFFALAGAALAWLAVIVALPIWAITVYTDLFRAEWVDDRAYSAAIVAFGLSVVLYLVGTVAALHPSRGALLVASLGVFVLQRETPGAGLFLVLLAVALWLGFLARKSFKPDLEEPLRRPAPVIAAALPVQYALWFLLGLGVLTGWSITVAFQEEGWDWVSQHAWNDYFSPGTGEFLSYRDELGALQHGLERIDGDRAAELAGQVELADRFSVERALRVPPSLGQPVFLDRSAPLVDAEHEIAWSFSHDRRLFRGRHQRTGEPVGWLGRDGSPPSTEDPGPGAVFSEVPTVVGDGLLVGPRRVYAFDARRQRIRERFEVPEAHERLVSAPTPWGSVIAVLSTRGLYLFDAREWARNSGRVEPASFLALPGDPRNLSRIDAAELIDGHLVSFAFDEPAAGRGLFDAEQVLVEVGVDGNVEVLGRVTLAQGLPELVRERGFVLSPLLQVFHDAAWAVVGPYRDASLPLGRLVFRPVSALTASAALGVALAGAVLALFAGRRRRLAGPELAAWVVGVLVTGLPGLLSFFLLAPGREASAPAEAPALGRLGHGAGVAP